MADEPAGFLGRWARRKEEVRKGKAVDEPVAAAPGVQAVPPVPAAEPVPNQAPADSAAPEAAAPKALTLDDARLLTQDSDFKPFMAGNVTPEVRNAAMKKLFADPHFNVMDGLDTYIDDYSKSDPIPESMLRQMASAKFLKLFDDDEEEEEKKVGAQNTAEASRESANNPTNETVAQSSYENPDIAPPEPAGPAETSQPAPPVAGASQEDHAHTDLRLQPDHAAPAPGAGRGTQ